MQFHRATSLYAPMLTKPRPRTCCTLIFYTCSHLCHTGRAWGPTPHRAYALDLLQYVVAGVHPLGPCLGQLCIGPTPSYPHSPSTLDLLFPIHHHMHPSYRPSRSYVHTSMLPTRYHKTDWF